jgi:hypothetical protein
MRRISVSMPRFRYERLPHFTQIAYDPGKPMFSEALSLPYSEKAASFWFGVQFDWTPIWV